MSHPFSKLLSQPSVHCYSIKAVTVDLLSKDPHCEAVRTLDSIAGGV